MSLIREKFENEREQSSNIGGSGIEAAIMSDTHTQASNRHRFVPVYQFIGEGPDVMTASSPPASLSRKAKSHIAERCAIFYHSSYSAPKCEGE